MTSPATVLIVDDERPLVALLETYLSREGYRVLRAYDGPSALVLAHDERPDLIVLDVMLPNVDGIEVCRRLRHFSDAYVLILTARADEVDKLVGLAIGADDYVTKPFSPRELVARTRALLRRPRSLATAQEAEQHPIIDREGLSIDLAGHEVRRGGQTILLTPIEFALLAALAASPGVVLSRDQLIDRVWGVDFPGDEHIVDVHLSNLRRKIESDSAHPRVVETVRGVGYRFARARR